MRRAGVVADNEFEKKVLSELVVPAEDMNVTFEVSERVCVAVAMTS